MREIKFRAWHIKRKKYYEVHHLHIGTIGIHEEDWATCKAFDCIEQKDIYIQIQPKECFIEQFTGLHDKNGKEIYEGDRVSRDGMDRNHITTVIFIDGAFCLCDDEGEYVDDICNGSEVIGNIHEATK